MGWSQLSRSRNQEGNPEGNQKGEQEGETVVFSRRSILLSPLLTVILLSFLLFFFLIYCVDTRNKVESLPPEYREQLILFLSTVTVLPSRPHIPGYERGKFGEGWSQSPLSFSSSMTLCSTREQVLLQHFPSSTSSSAPHLCPRPTGQVEDPYTGQDISPEDTDIDHIYPLSAAWDHGAHSWTYERRIDFANDQKLNLLPTESKVNRVKSDSTPESWLPPHKEKHCSYIFVYMQVAHHYGLSISQGDYDTAQAACKLSVPQSS